MEDKSAAAAPLYACHFGYGAKILQRTLFWQPLKSAKKRTRQKNGTLILGVRYFILISADEKQKFVDRAVSADFV